MNRENKSFRFIAGTLVVSFAMMIATVISSRYSETMYVDIEFLFRATSVIFVIDVVLILGMKRPDRFMIFTLLCELTILIGYISPNYGTPEKIKFIGYVNSIVFFVALVQLTRELQNYKKEQEET